MMETKGVADDGMWRKQEKRNNVCVDANSLCLMGTPRGIIYHSKTIISMGRNRAATFIDGEGR